MEHSRIRLVTRGDDCGSSQTANRAILDACQKGILKNTSLMVTCQFIEAAEMFLDQDICFGIHATLNAEWDNVRWGPVLPVEEVPSLVHKDGNFFQTPRKLHENNPRLEEVMAEVQAQLDKARGLGFDIKYADMHMGFGWVIEGLVEEFNLWCQREGLINGDTISPSLPVEKTDGDPVEEFIASLEKAEPGQYLIVGHPGYDSEDLRSLGHKGYPGNEVARTRDWQRKIFMDKRVIEYCQNNNVLPVRFDQAVN